MGKDSSQAKRKRAREREIYLEIRTQSPKAGISVDAIQELVDVGEEEKKTSSV